MMQEIREARHITRDELAKRLHVTYATIRNWETGEREFTISTACAICDALGCTLDELAGRDAPAASKAIAGFDALTPENKAKVSGYISGLKDGQQ